MLQNHIISCRHALQQWWHQIYPPSTYCFGKPRLDYPQWRLPRFVRYCSVSMSYYHFFRPLNWDSFPQLIPTEKQFQTTTPHASFILACLIKLDKQMPYMSHLRQYLLDHPGLVWLLGFRLVASSKVPWGFDADASLPTARHFTRLLRQLPPTLFQGLLEESIRLLREALPDEITDFGQAISLDTKHILPWVKENNHKAYVEGRYDKNKQPRGDSDCKLGCKKRHNQHGNTELTPTHNPDPASRVQVGEFHWGYASGVVATKVAGWGEFVLAELTQTFDKADVSYFLPLMEATEKRLGSRPHFGAFDAAFDAHYVYDYFHRPEQDWQSAFAAVPYNKRNGKRKQFDEHGHPFCEAQLVMTLGYQFTSRATLYEHQRDHYVCPIKDTHPECPIAHKRWAKGGCTTRLPSGAGSRVRHQIERDSDLYKRIYKQRTATERINAQAVALGIERPKLRNRHAIANQNTLIYVLINLRAWRRICQKKATQ